MGHVPLKMIDQINQKGDEKRMKNIKVRKAESANATAWWIIV